MTSYEEFIKSGHRHLSYPSPLVQPLFLPLSHCPSPLLKLKFFLMTLLQQNWNFKTVFFTYIIYEFNIKCSQLERNSWCAFQRYFFVSAYTLRSKIFFNLITTVSLQSDTIYLWKILQDHQIRRQILLSIFLKNERFWVEKVYSVTFQRMEN